MLQAELAKSRPGQVDQERLLGELAPQTDTDLRLHGNPLSSIASMRNSRACTNSNGRGGTLSGRAQAVHRLLICLRRDLPYPA